MSTIWLFRHGQAGTRDAYDALSGKGHRQARLLGEHLAARGIVFSAAITGSLNRQQQTARHIASAYRGFPALVVEPRWNEFDLDRVYRELASILCEEDPAFRGEFEALREDREAADRRWMPGDFRIVQAWIAGHPRYSGESWLAFHRRIRDCQATIPDLGEDAHVAVFTSATPIAIWAALGMDVEDRRAMRLAAVLRNASWSTFRLAGGLRLQTFNVTPPWKSDLDTLR